MLAYETGWTSPEYGGGGGGISFSPYYMDSDGLMVSKWHEYRRGIDSMRDTTVCNCVQAPCDCDTPTPTTGGSGSPSNDNPTVRPTHAQILNELSGLFNSDVKYGFKQAANQIFVPPSAAGGNNNLVLVVVVLAVAGYGLYWINKNV